MRPVNSIYTPLSGDNSTTAPHTNTFSKNIHSVTNRESDLAKKMRSTSIMVPRYESMVLSSDQEDGGLDTYSNKDINAILNEGSQLSLMAYETHSSIQTRGIFQPSASSGKGQMKKSLLCALAGVSVGFGVVGACYLFNRQYSATPDQSNMLNSSLPTSQPYSAYDSFSKSELLLSQREGYRKVREHRPEKMQQLEINTPSLSIEIDSNYTVSHNSDQRLISKWSEWMEEALPGTQEQKDRKSALNALIDCLKNHPDFLEIKHLKSLTVLPESLPHTLKGLILDNNGLIRLPENLPPQLEELYVIVNRLTRLPNNLPPTLTILEVECNQLTQLPRNLPLTLRILGINYNLFTSLPENLPAKLESLYATGNQLQQLPQKLSTMAELKELYIDHNRFTCLPEDLPHSLRILFVEGNPLTHLPKKLPPHLETTSVSNNQLHYRPEDLRPALNKYFNCTRTND